MSDTVIRVENLGKKYIIGHQRRERYTTLRDMMTEKARSLGQIFSRNGKDDDPAHEEFWALKDVSFEIKQGDRVGIIGRNGAGKSTLLKILSRITEPTEGRISIKGRIASLLEVGTGFHPELTGRENIYLNGAILGMGKREIRRKFDEIVAFAEVEKFLDTPVKRYSSGMYVRLAFAVAAHLEPEILIVDEVLAVGDAQFQKKCLGKMEDVSQEGRTVLFVSHNMSVIQKMCCSGIFLSQGMIRSQGDVNSVTEKYLNDIYLSTQSISLSERRDRSGSGRIKIVDFQVLDLNDVPQEVLRSGYNYKFIIHYKKSEENRVFNEVVGSIAIVDNTSQIVWLVRSNFTNDNFSVISNIGRIECCVEDFNLAEGNYSTTLFLSYRDSEVLDSIQYAKEFRVESGIFFETGSPGLPSHCKVLTRAKWKVV